MFGTSKLCVALALALITACGGDDPPPNTAPTVGALTLTGDEDLPVTGNLVVTDAENDPVTVTHGTPAHGTLVRAANVLTYTPEPNFHGTDSVDVTVSDGELASTITVAITIAPVNDAPVTVGDAFATAEDTALALAPTAVLANDIEVDGDALTVTAVGNATNGTVALVAGEVVFTPAADFGGAASFEYTVSDGDLTDVGAVTITVGDANDAPVAGDDAATTDEDTAVTIPAATLLANDTDAENQTLMITAVDAATHGTVVLAGTDVTFTPEAGFNGTATFAYTVSDGMLTDTGTVTVTIAAVNDAPVAAGDAATTAEDTAVVVTAATLLANDTDADADALTVTAATDATNGTLGFDATTGDVTFTPTANFVGTGTFTYTISDGAATASALVTVTITAANDAPAAADDMALTDEDTAVVIAGTTLTGNDIDIDGDALTITAVANATHGTVALAGGQVTFTPAASFQGNASFDYTVSDGAATDVGTVTVVVSPVNDAPVATDDAAQTDEDTAVVIDASTLTGNDADADGDALAVTAVANASNGTVALAAGQITFTPAADFSGAASFEYTVSDGTATDVGAVAVTVAAVNDAPVAADDTAAAEAGVATDFPAAQLLSNDTDIDGTPTITAVGNPTNGTVTLAGTTITFTATAAGTASFEYTLSDGALTDTALVTLTVVATNVCGDGVVFGAEACDDNNMNPGDGCSASCAVEVGWACTGSPSACTPICGDGALAGPEACDDGGTAPGDGCSASCEVEAGYSCAGAPSACAATCGDGVVAVGAEACDDSGTVPGDGCSASCATEPGYACAGSPSACATVCGDGVVTPDEQCDDGNVADADGCTSLCVPGVVCDAIAAPGGDAFAVDPVTGHCYVAFDGDQTTFGGAYAACAGIGGHLATITSSDEQARVAGVQNDAENPWIGGSEDGNDTDAVFNWVTGEAFGFTRFAADQPDDDAGLGGNGECLHLVNAAGDWNDTNCDLAGFVTGRICELALEPCGDRVLQAAIGEECDDGNVTAGDGCNATCGVEAGCGNGTLDAGEQCDDDNLAAGDGCSATCQFEGCGDGAVGAGETCDDGNRTNGDGCSAICETETLFFSEYTEGSSSNKAIEIRNPSSTAGVDLAASACAVRGYANGMMSFTAIALTGTIAPGDVYVLANTAAAPAILAVADQTSGSVNFNGDDVVELVCGATPVTVDVIGQIGFDPGTEWGTGLVSTADNTIRRKCAHRNGDTVGTDAFDPALEWDGFAFETFGGFGVAECVP